ncbi:MAG TPA: dynamin family protein [Segeticoccus sp.]|uniref:dynamin family protein n=1 Tax=Segeticoccus sp. TaxID=2706531 RepID=UPI002D7F57AF|nr:dynamin family protein [Segeticoccus sp.]HET8598716.1 dynamin family protein [Segeticoccus sp.]
MTGPPSPPDGGRLLAAVQQLRGEVAGTRLPLPLPGTEDAERAGDQLLKQLDDYVLPRLSALDAPLLAVVGGSTGAGKSTIVNSLVGEVVTRAGVLRPTTRASVLVHHPHDTRWFTDQRVLPGLARVTATRRPDEPARRGTYAGTATEDPSSVRLVAAESILPGLALLDAPDIDSVVRANRELAHQLLSAADLWVFVTTAARYADAVPWGLLREAADRGTSVAIVLDRVPPEAMAEVRGHLAEMLREHGLQDAPVFPVPETQLSREGLLPERDVARLHSWLSALARDAKARATVIRRTLGGALDSLPARVGHLADAGAAQVEALDALQAAATTAYADALAEVERGMTDGTLLRGEVLARWQEFVGTGEFLRQIEAGVSRLRDRITALFKGAPPPSRDLGEALQTGAASLLTSEAQSAAAATARQWRRLAGGGSLVEAHPDLAKGSPDLPATVDRAVRDWQGYVLQLVRDEGQDRRTTARVLAFGVNGIAVVLMLVAFSQTGGLVGAEVGIAGGAAVLAQRLLEAVFGDQAVRTLAAKARKELIRRTADVYADERVRFERLLTEVAVDPEQPQRLSSALAAVERAR